MGIVLTVLLFGVLILIHEFGHFITAKLSGVKVNEFALGMGPVLFKKVKNGTQYALRLLPIGGFVSMEGEDEASEAEGSFSKAPVWRRIMIVLAGAFMNLLLGFLLLTVIVTMQNALGTTTVAKFEDGATSSQLLQLEDEILTINGSAIHIDYDIVYTMMRDPDGFVDMTVLRDGEKIELTNVPFSTEQMEDGSVVTTLDFKVYGKEKSVFGVLKYSFYYTGTVAKLVWTSLIDIITGRYGINQLSGPVGVASAVSEATAMGLRSLLMLAAFITVNLGVFNLLPIPALDGGRLLFLLIEAVRGKPLDPKYEGFVHGLGFVLLFGLMIIVTFNDIVRLFKG